MKYSHIFIIALCAAVFFSACEEKHESAPGLPPPIPFTYSVIIKLSSPEYKDYVIGEHTFDGTGYCIRGSGGACQELYIGNNSPLIPLPNDYYAIDWKWGNFIYRPSNYIIDVKWTDVQARRQTWDRESTAAIDSFYHSMPCWAIVRWGSIDTYLHIPPHGKKHPNYNYVEAYVWPGWHSRYNSYTDLIVAQDATDRETYDKQAHFLDSLQDVYLERLALVIEQDSLARVAYIY